MYTIFDSLLKEYPYLDINNNKGLLSDCSYISCYLLKYETIFYDFLKIYDIKPESLFYECFMNLFSDIFISEQLYRVWDEIILDFIIA